MLPRASGRTPPAPSRSAGRLVRRALSPIGPAHAVPSDTAPAPPPACLLGLTARIVSAHVGRNPVALERFPELIRGVHRALGGLAQGGAANRPSVATGHL